MWGGRRKRDMAVSSGGWKRGGPVPPPVNGRGIPRAAGARALARALLKPGGCSSMTRRLASFHSLARLSAVVLVAGCFTGPINQHPRVELDSPAATVLRGKDASFMVDATDPDGDPLDLTWGVADGKCPGDPQSWSGEHRQLAAGERKIVVEGSATWGPFCVCVFAVDSHHATSASCRDETPVNRPPDPRLRVVSPVTSQPFPLFSLVRVSAAGTVDPDAAPGEIIRYDWELERPSESPSNAKLESCSDNAELDRCFLGDVSEGSFTVTVRATDSLEEGLSAMVPVKIAKDRLPCIHVRDTTPELTSLTYDDNPDAPQTITVHTVDDDGDPYPRGDHGQIQFTWFAGLVNGPMSPRGGNFNSFTPVDNQVGDEVRVRVEIRDRNFKNIDDILTGCWMSGGALCESSPGSGCFLGATWTVRFNL